MVVGVEVGAGEEEVVGVVDSRLVHTMVDKFEPVGVVVVDSMWVHKTVDKFGVVVVGVAKRPEPDSSLVRMLERILAYTLVGREEGVGVAQGEGEGWRGPVRSGDVAPNVRGLVDGHTVVDTRVQLVALFLRHFRFHLHFRIRQPHLENKNPERGFLSL